MIVASAWMGDKGGESGVLVLGMVVQARNFINARAVACEDFDSNKMSYLVTRASLRPRLTSRLYGRSQGYHSLPTPHDPLRKEIPSRSQRPMQVYLLGWFVDVVKKVEVG